VATSDSPTGPWEFSDTPAVAPRQNPETGGCNFFWTFDPDVLGDTVETTSPFYYGSYYGGVFGAPMTFTEDGATIGAPTQVAIGNRYEGANVVEKDGYYYFFGSATNCCNGALTGYSVFAGRSESPYGPFVDREGVSLLAGEVGGTPVISMNGNRWVGTGHNSVFQDAAGQWWTAYHAVDQQDPFFSQEPGFTKRPVLLDPIDWIDGWPTVRGGLWASDTRMPAPAAQEGQRSRYRPRLVAPQEPGRVLRSEQFDSGLDGWSWVREPDASTYEVADGVLRWETQAGDLFVDSNSASVLTTRAPRGDYVVETRVRMDVPPEGCCFNYVQAGLVLYGDDDNFIKLVEASIWETRQTEFAKELNPVPFEGQNRYGNTVVGPPGEWTSLRIVVERLNPREQREAGGDTERYTAYTSRDGDRWVRGGAWTHTLGRAQIGLVSMGGTGFTAEFDEVTVSTLRHGRPGR
jgi:arabinan endo-1,5-alpha-L-arabinosidase